MKHFTYEEMELMSIYDPGTREGLMNTLKAQAVEIILNELVFS